MNETTYSLPRDSALINDTQCDSQLSLPFSLDPSIKWPLSTEMHLFNCSQDTAFLSYMPRPSIEHYFDNFYNASSQTTCPKHSHRESYYVPSFIRRRNERERQRVKYVNEGYARLRKHLPPEYLEKRLSKVQTLKAAIKYISLLQDCLGRSTTEITHLSYRTACCPVF
uniref:BHLH domain-containing protein n=1 Tax=Leptobrachium leishanense TaxID=445787 RepID=A0A8C5P7Q2_9ANUR